MQCTCLHIVVSSSLRIFICTNILWILISLSFLFSYSYNVSILDEWLRSRGLQAGGAVAILEPLIQAVQLLQAGKKTEADAQALVQTCTALSSQQVGPSFISLIKKTYCPLITVYHRLLVSYFRL